VPDIAARFSGASGRALLLLLLLGGASGHKRVFVRHRETTAMMSPPIDIIVKQ
jgi:hypothetical protein